MHDEIDPTSNRVYGHDNDNDNCHASCPNDSTSTITHAVATTNCFDVFTTNNFRIN